MKKLHLFKTVLLLCAMIVGSSSVWATTQTWDLTTADFSSATNDLVTWTSVNVDFTVAKNGSSTNPNNYLGGIASDTETRFYKKNLLTFTPKNGATISSIVVTQTDTGTGITSSSAVKTNCSASKSTNTVTITPSDGTKACSVALNGTTKIATIVVNYTGGSDKKDAPIKFEKTEFFIGVGDTYANTLTNTQGLAVTYSNNSGDATATINSSTGEVTGVGVGKLTITASWEEQTIGTTTYVAGSKSYTLYVGNAVVDASFNFTNYQMYGSTLPLSTLTSSYVGKTGYVFTAGDVTITTGGTGYVCYYNVKANDASNNNYFALYENANMTISVPSGFVITRIEFTGKQNTNKMTFNTGAYATGAASGSSTWEGIAQSVTATRGTGNVNLYTITVTYTNKFTKEVGDANWATWIAPYNVEVPSEVSAYIVSSSDDSKATLGELLAIPANTPVLLKGEGSHDFVVCDDETLEANEVDPESNLLEVSDEETTSGVYVLANRDSHGVGFYLWDGGLLGAGYVYLPANVSARDFIGFDFEETTAISNLSDKTKEVRSEFFNLAGQRIAKPMKGLYITNGKKIIIK